MFFCCCFFFRPSQFFYYPQFPIRIRYPQVSGPDFTDTRYQSDKQGIEVNEVAPSKCETC